MTKSEFLINNIPTVLYGDKSDKLFIFLHGQGGNKYEAEKFAQVALYGDYQVLSVDLPKHGGRCDEVLFLPWIVKDELLAVMDFAKIRWKQISVRATSIGAYFSLLAFKNEKIEKCLFVSPLLDMESMIIGMMRAANVSEQTLRDKKIIELKNGQTLSWEYLCFARENKVKTLCAQSYIFYASGDTLIGRDTIDKFVKENNCDLFVMDGGEHWLHTQEQLDAVKTWEFGILKGDSTNGNF